jgi:hypothetical protein
MKARGLEKKEGYGDDYARAYVEGALDAGIISEAFSDYNTNAERGDIFITAVEAIDYVADS